MAPAWEACPPFVAIRDDVFNADNDQHSTEIARRLVFTAQYRPHMTQQTTDGAQHTDHKNVVQCTMNGRRMHDH